MTHKIVEDASFGIIPLRQVEGVWEVLLILHRGGHHWAFPKGHKNPGESAKQSAERELKEETGLDIERFLLDTPLMEKYQFRRRHEVVFKTVSYFPAIVKGQVRLQAEEIQDAKWTPLKKAENQLTYKEAKSMCLELVKILNESLT
jgi:bis(5'-nucleosidyl)-tetraphosphatase